MADRGAERNVAAFLGGITRAYSARELAKRQQADKTYQYMLESPQWRPVTETGGVPTYEQLWKRQGIQFEPYSAEAEKAKIQQQQYIQEQTLMDAMHRRRQSDLINGLKAIYKVDMTINNLKQQLKNPMLRQNDATRIQDQIAELMARKNIVQKQYKQLENQMIVHSESYKKAMPHTVPRPLLKREEMSLENQYKQNLMDREYMYKEMLKRLDLVAKQAKTNAERRKIETQKDKMEVELARTLDEIEKSKQPIWQQIFRPFGITKQPTTFAENVLRRRFGGNQTQKYSTELLRKAGEYLRKFDQEDTLANRQAVIDRGLVK